VRGRNPFLYKLEADLTLELEDILTQEEILWFLKSWSEWIASGDRNTKYFHTMAVVRRIIQKVESLRQEDGSWTHDAEVIQGLATEFFRALYTQEDDNLHGNLSYLFPNIGEEVIASLSHPVTMKEIHRAVFDMGP
jgi:hypothetical protein